MKLKNLTFTETIKFFNEELLLDTSITFNNQNKTTEKKLPKEEVMVIDEVKELKNYYLKEYLISRSIDSEIGKKYLKEIYFSYKGKPLYALGFKNDTEGYELRNSFYKGNIGGKDITYIQESEMKKDLVIFEGFMNFLSYKTFNKGKEEDKDYIILNTSSLVQPLENIEELKKGSISHKIYDTLSKYDKITTFLQERKPQEL